MNATHSMRSSNDRGVASDRVTVIVPVYNAYEHLRECAAALFEHTSPQHRMLFIDDASTDERVHPLLLGLARTRKGVSVLRNNRNLGYTSTINRGCQRARGDVVLLNGDTRVTPRWLDKLRQAAYSRSHVATVTPLSNAAGAFSVPVNNRDNAIPAHLTPAAMAALVEWLSSARYPQAPTGNGYCMYVTRHALDTVGLFDAEAFPRGYGEENDFCMRARALGFVHLVDDTTFIYHRRGASFGESREPLLARAREIIQSRHPQYKILVTEFLAHDPLVALRERLGAALRTQPRYALRPRRPPDDPPTVLSIVHGGGGGSVLTNRDLMAALSPHMRCLILACDRSEWVLYDVRSGIWPQRRVTLAREWDAMPSMGEVERQLLAGLCQEFRVDVAHVRSLIGTGPEVVPLLKRLGIAVVFSFHDFLAICPTIQLIDDGGRYCGGVCTPSAGDCPVTTRWFPDLPPLKHEYVYAWRQRMRVCLAQADAFVTASRAAAEVLQHHFDFLDETNFHIIEHGRDRGAFRSVAARPSTRPVRIIVFGALGPSKGLDLIQAIMQLNEAQRGPFEFHVLGDKHPRFDPDALGGLYHGSYARDALPGLLAGIRPSFSLIASIWPETYSHTLTESWLAGIPAFVSDIGTLRERVCAQGGGWLIPYQDPHACYERMAAVAADRGEWSRRRAEIQRITLPGCAQMAERYRALYLKVLGRDVVPTGESGGTGLESARGIAPAAL